MADQPLYTSPCAARRLWHEYRVYPDRLELDTLAGTLIVPFDQIEGVHVADSYLQGMRLQLAGFRPGVKLDLADFHPHVVLDKASGVFRHVAFTPSDPAAFRAVLEAALAAYRAGPPDEQSHA
jgi:hypothetical protein